jgi:hypothetical protein
MDNMRETGVLKVLADFNISEQHIVINPNDGFDIGLMMTEAPVSLFLGDSVDMLHNGSAVAIEGIVVQKNECRLGTVELSSRSLERIGSPGSVRLHLLPSSPRPRLLISPA